MSAETDPAGMSRRQLIRHGAWFGAAVVLTVAGGEVISHVAGSGGAAQQATPALSFGTLGGGHLGTDQLDFIQKDVAPLSSDTPIIVFSHIPLFAMYPAWGWATDDAVQALSYLKRFSSVTCLNGHVHQLFSKTEGNITFYCGTTTAYPLPH